MTQKCHDCDPFLPRKICNLLGKSSFHELQVGDMTECIMTVMFIDIRGFTTLAESQRAADNFRFLNRYLAAVVPVIEAHGGFIDKFIGDAVMALFPDKPENALECAVALIGQMGQFGAGTVCKGSPPLRIGIGINTGFVILGVVGTATRMELTVVGDTVNLASRMETLTKTYGTSILISGHTYHRLQLVDPFEIRFVDRVFVKGKRVPQAVYEVCAADDSPLRASKQANQELFYHAVAHYHFQQTVEATRLFRSLVAKNPRDTVAAAYLKKCLPTEDSSQSQSVHLDQRPLSWGDDLRTGNDMIDEQHRQLFSKADILLNMITAGDFSGIHEVEVFLTNYIDEHFSCEEAVMRQAKYPFLREHQVLHRQFSAAFARLIQEFESSQENGIYKAFRLQVLVIEWLQNHILKIDQHFSRFL